MTGPNTPPADADLTRLFARVERLERARHEPGPRTFAGQDDVDADFPGNGDVPIYNASLQKYQPGTPSGILTFSYPGALETGVESPPWYPTMPVTFATVRVSRLASGAADVVIDIKVNGSTITTVTLSSGSSTTTESGTPVPVALGDALTVAVNDAGDGENVSVEMIP